MRAKFKLNSIHYFFFEQNINKLKNQRAVEIHYADVAAKSVAYTKKSTNTEKLI